MRALAALLLTGCSGWAWADYPAPSALELAPDPGLEAPTAEAARQWQAATGIPVWVGDSDDAVPVMWVTELPPHRETGGCTAGDAAPFRIRISRLCNGDLYYILLHEVGHVLASELGHAEAGIMSATPAGQRSLDGDAVAYVCGARPCPLNERSILQR